MLTQKISMPTELTYAFVNIIMECYRGDDKLFDDVESVLTRYIPDPELLALCSEMRSSWDRSIHLIRRVMDEEAQNMAKNPPSGEERRKANRVMGVLETSISLYGGEKLYWDILNDPRYVDDKGYSVFNTAVERGCVCYARLRCNAYLALAKIIYAIRRKIEEYHHAADITDMIGTYAARFASRLEASIYRGAGDKYVEERSILQVLAAYGLSPTPFPFEFVEDYIRKGMEQAGLKLATDINPYLAPLSDEARSAFYELHNGETVRQRMAWVEAVFQSGETMRKLKLIPQPTYAKRRLYDGLPTPFFEVPGECWKVSVAKTDMFPMDVLSGDVPLEPISPRSLPLFSVGKQVPIQAVFGPLGHGKTVILDALASFRIQKGYIVFRPNMPRSQSLGVCLPLQPVTRQLKRDYEYLTKRLRIKPRGYPAVFFTVAENEGQIDKDAVYTKHDVIIFVKDLKDFSLNWSKLMEPISKGGYLIARGLKDPNKTHIMRSTLFRNFFKWREKNRSKKIAIQSDEVWEMVRAVYGGSEEAKVAHSVKDALKDVRGLNFPFDYGTQRSTDINPIIIAMITTNGSFLFGYLPETAKEAWRSPRSQILGMVEANISDHEKQYITTIEKIMSNIPLQDNYLFFWVHKRRLRLIRACLPPHCPEVTDVNIREVFKRVEKETGEKVTVPYEAVEKIRLGKKGEKVDESREGWKS